MGTQGVVLSTDEYFLNTGQYCFNKNTLPEAHIWNKKRGRFFIFIVPSPSACRFISQKHPVLSLY